MNDKFKKKLAYIVVMLCIIILSIIAKVVMPDSQVNDNLDKLQTEVLKEIIVSEETKSEVADTKNVVENGGKVETVEIAKATIKEEQEVTDAGADESLLEQDALLEQENISYNGDNKGNGLSLLGSYQGLTYYSQADSRWASSSYTITNNKKQTIKSSGCGPTSAAMVVSSSKGAILPSTMASLFLDNGFRTANSGTAWSAYSFVADYFGFKEFYTTSDYNYMLSYLKRGYFVICSCGSGLFTTGGHYIVLVEDNDGTIRVFDPYLYDGKFNTASRRVANVKVKGTSAYVSEKNFKKYANYKRFWIFSNDSKKDSKKSNKNVKKTYTRYVKVNTYLNVRKSNNLKSKVVGKKKNGDKVTVYETKNGFSRIGENKWVSSSYLTTHQVKNTVGKKKVLKQNCYLYKNSNLKGTRYTYRANTTVKVLKNISSSVDYVQVIATGRKAYIKISNYK